MIVWRAVVASLRPRVFSFRSKVTKNFVACLLKIRYCNSMYNIFIWLVSIFMTFIFVFVQACSIESRKMIVVSVSPQSRASIAAKYRLSAQECAAKLTSYLKRRGVDFVFDTTFAREFSLVESSREFVRRYRRRESDPTALPMLTSACPGKQLFLNTSMIIVTSFMMRVFVNIIVSALRLTKSFRQILNMVIIYGPYSCCKRWLSSKYWTKSCCYKLQCSCRLGLLRRKNARLIRVTLHFDNQITPTDHGQLCEGSHGKTAKQVHPLTYTTVFRLF